MPCGERFSIFESLKIRDRFTLFHVKLLKNQLTILENQKMVDVDFVLKNWDRPVRPPERAQLTLRIPIPLHQQILALKELYPSQALNDMVSDIIELGLNAVVEKLPTYEWDKSAIEDMQKHGFYNGEQVGQEYGPKVDFWNALGRIKSSSPKVEDAA